MKVEHHSDQHLEIQHHLIKVKEHLTKVKELTGTDETFEPELATLFQRVKKLSEAVKP